MDISSLIASARATGQAFLETEVSVQGQTFSVSNALLVIGGVWVLFTVGIWISAALSSVWQSCTRRSVSSFGKWAVVTGATDGIGKAYAFQLAKKKMSVVLISRTKEKLEATAAELQKAVSGAEVAIVVADFSAPPESGLYENIKAALADKEVGVLVNNVGVSYPCAMYYDELEAHAPGLIRTMVHMNVSSVAEMTAIVLPGMLQRRKGAIVNIASAASRASIGSPLLALYSGTKAFVDYFSRSLHHEYANKGIVVTCQSPYFVATKLAKIRVASLAAPSPDTYAAAAVAAIGDGSSTVPYWAHAAQDWIIQSVPTGLLASQIMGMHLGLRKRFMAKTKVSAGAPDKVASPAARASTPSKAVKPKTG